MGFFSDYYIIMDKEFLSRLHLESMSTADLISLADDYGIDIPDNLNRRFIIRELLEFAEELRLGQEENVVISDNIEISESLPQSYNETKIYAVLRNPVWVFVFWDIQENQFSSLVEDEEFSGFFLQPVFFDSKTAELSSDFFEIQITPADRQQYVFIPTGKKYLSVYLKCNLGSKGIQTLAYTARILLPPTSKMVSELQPGKKLNVPPLLELSGMEELLREQFVEYRQTF